MIYMGNQTRFSGIFCAYNYGQWIARIYGGVSSSGAGTIQVYYPNVTLPDGHSIVPFATTAPLLIGAGATAETVTPTAVSNAQSINQVIGQCSITATFSFAHGEGEIIQSGTFGLAEAVNDAHSQGGGVVMVDSAWVAAGGVVGTITAQLGYTNVSIVDGRGTVSGSAFSFSAASNGAAYVVTARSWY